MDIQQLNRTDAEKIFLAFKTVSGAGSITMNSPVALVCDGTSIDGVSAIHVAASSIVGWIGIADKTVAINGFGRSQAWGYRDSIMISNETTSITITGGDALTPVAGTGLGLSSVGGVTLSFLNSKVAIIGETITLSQGQTFAKGIIRAL